MDGERRRVCCQPLAWDMRSDASTKLQNWHSQQFRVGSSLRSASLERPFGWPPQAIAKIDVLPGRGIRGVLPALL